MGSTRLGTYAGESIASSSEALPASQSYRSGPSRTGVTLAARAVAIDLVQGGSESKPPTRLPVSLVVEEVAGLAFQRPAELIERA